VRSDGPPALADRWWGRMYSHIKARVRLVAASGDQCGEGAFWCGEEGAVYWTDINRFLVHRLDYSSGATRTWEFDEPATALAPTERAGWVLVVLASRTILWRPATDERLAWHGEHRRGPGIRNNDARVDPRGSLWIGTMADNVGPSGEPKPVRDSLGELLRIDFDGHITSWASGVGISNTVCWNPDGRRMYFGDSLEDVIYCYTFDPSNGDISERRPFLRGFGRGVPDGSAVDAEGYLWNCRYGGGCIVRVAPTGEVDGIVEMPTANPTTCTFGGPGLRTLFVTSARLDTQPTDRLAGSLFAIETSTPGLPENKLAVGFQLQEFRPIGLARRWIDEPDFPVDVLAIGECMIELASDADGNFRLSYGGDTFNTAIYLSRSGLKVSYFTALSDDRYSNAILALAASEGLQTDAVIEPGMRPGLYIVETDSSGERCFSYWRKQSPARNYFQTSDVGRIASAVRNARMVYLTGVTLALCSEKNLSDLFHVIDDARARGTRLVFDPNYRPQLWPQGAPWARSAFTECLRRVDIALPTFEDECLLWGDASVEFVFERMASLGVGEIVVKNGPRGAFVNDRTHVPVPEPVLAVDTTGAGDAFNAAYIASRLSGLNPAKAAAAGHRLAGNVVRHRGAIIPRAFCELPHWEAIAEPDIATETSALHAIKAGS
jgi:sugar lactone lactonase YvrE/sugar/nucleoside kinase (ribokinase family)